MRRITPLAESEATPRARRWWSPVLAPLLLVLATFAVNANAMGAFFVGDDFEFLYLMPRVDSVLDSMRIVFWGEWEPLWYLSWYIDDRLWGQSPFGYHLTNTVFLAVAVVSLYGFVRTVWPACRLAAWAAALLFLTHPLHDEAVTYLAARGHLMGTALALTALWLYARGRRHEASDAARTVFLTGGFLFAFHAPLAKEVLLGLPVWIGGCEWLLVQRQRAPLRRLLAGVGAGLLMLLAVGATIVLRHRVIGLDSSKLEGVAGDWGKLLERMQELPDYALLGGLPLPFGEIDAMTLVAWRPLGWVLLAASVAAGLAALYPAAMRRRVVSSPALPLFCVGLAIALIGVGPAFWADLPLRRRYLFAPSVGTTMMAASVLALFATRFPRAARVTLALLVAGGAANSIYRNDLYRCAGVITRELIETARDAPLGEPPGPLGARPPVISLVTVPRAYGGDYITGAYIFHQTDVEAALAAFGFRPQRLAFALKCFYADDYTCVATPRGSALAYTLSVSFRSRRAYDAARGRDPNQDRRGHAVTATLQAENPQSLTLTYRLILDRQFLLPTRRLLRYSDGRFHDLDPREDTRESPARR